MGSGELNEVPAVPEGITPDGNSAIGFMAGGFFEGDTCSLHRAVVAFKIIGGEKQANAAAELIADGGLLYIAFGAGEDQAAL